ncbi:carbohydrate esterase family 5 protein [Viridothelium virens]|uniref:Carbohydrate esterase family 5 protein n=1 Tax=Viridothelium virens TaxID=1048519 RepID=A0A6A6HQ60_VIRVR|nr:carbohydrate esterase family 5 protein [Viridothelium virens]
MFYKIAAALVVSQALAAPLERRACPNIHVFGARETTAAAGYGSAGTVVNLILNAHSGSTAEAISYPAAGGSDYGSSVQAGVSAVASQVNSFNSECPSTELVLVGYSQGAQIFDDALCGGGDTNQGISSTAATISTAAQAQVKAVIWMGDPRHSPGEPFNVGTSTAGGFDARPNGFTCGSFSSKIQSYCDAADPYCSNGNDAATHQGYGSEYGQAALTFVNSKL